MSASNHHNEHNMYVSTFNQSILNSHEMLDVSRASLEFKTCMKMYLKKILNSTHINKHKHDHNV